MLSIIKIIKIYVKILWKWLFSKGWWGFYNWKKCMRTWVENFNCKNLIIPQKNTATKLLFWALPPFMWLINASLSDRQHEEIISIKKIAF